MKINTITLTNKDQNVSWELSADELNTLLSDLADDLAYGKLPRKKSKYKIKLVSGIIGIILNSPVSEFCFRTVKEYIQSKGFQKVEKKRGRPKKELKYYSTMDDVEQAGIGGDIEWHEINQ